MNSTFFIMMTAALHAYDSTNTMAPSSQNRNTLVEATSSAHTEIFLWIQLLDYRFLFCNFSRCSAPCDVIAFNLTHSLVWFLISVDLSQFFLSPLLSLACAFDFLRSSFFLLKRFFPAQESHFDCNVFGTLDKLIRLIAELKLLSLFISSQNWVCKLMFILIAFILECLFTDECLWNTHTIMK